MIYQVKTGHDQLLANLSTFAPQPHCDGLQYTRSSSMADRTTYNEGAFFVLVWDVTKNATSYLAHLTLCGLDDEEEAEVTVYGPSRRYGSALYNAIARLPLVGQEVNKRNYFINPSILFTDLTEL